MIKQITTLEELKELIKEKEKNSINEENEEEVIISFSDDKLAKMYIDWLTLGEESYEN